MARTPDVAGALEAVVARTIKSTIGPRFRKLDTQLRRLERRLRQIALKRGLPAARRGRKAGRKGAVPKATARRGGMRRRMTRRGRR